MLMPIYDVCNSYMGYEGGGRSREPWGWQTAAQKNLMDTVEDILAGARTQQQGSIRIGEGEGREEVAESESGIK